MFFILWNGPRCLLTLISVPRYLSSQQIESVHLILLLYICCLDSNGFERIILFDLPNVSVYFLFFYFLPILFL